MKRVEIGLVSLFLAGSILGCGSRGTDSNLAASARGPRTFYVDSVAGSDVASGTSLSTPWKSLTYSRRPAAP
ncbi:MAG: hypothetical protein M3Q07_27520 [Pseudobdellovibrionaceae bacterium]|nr:hypothetical protein [Pseudobdellovibrionaceae bacterium]